MRNSRGFTLIEIIVAVTLVAILSAAVAPSVLNNISQGRIARTQSDVQAIASAIMKFKSETGKFPNLVMPGDPDSSQTLDFLATASVADDLPNKGGTNWPEALTSGSYADGSTETVANHLILGLTDNGTASIDSYPRIPAGANADDPTIVGFRSGLISSAPLDPWGHAYLINVASLDSLSGNPVWVISAGPNGLMQTDVEATGTDAVTTLGGDDIGFRVK